MPIATVILLLDITFVFHAYRTGRLCPWAYIILAIPGFGALAYVAFEIAPEWFGSIEGRKAQARVGRALNPDKHYRALAAALAVADTVANRVALADECLRLEKFGEARVQFAAVLAQPQGDEPAFYFGKAQAEFGLGEPAAAVATLDALRVRFPDWQSDRAHLLYARALEADGRDLAALEEYRALAGYHGGAEVRVRLGHLLRRVGREAEARVAFAEVVAVMSRQPKFARRMQAEWIAAAEKALQG